MFLWGSDSKTGESGLGANISGFNMGMLESQWVTRSWEAASSRCLCLALQNSHLLPCQDWYGCRLATPTLPSRSSMRHQDDCVYAELHMGTPWLLCALQPHPNSASFVCSIRVPLFTWRIKGWLWGMCCISQQQAQPLPHGERLITFTSK